MTPVLALDIGNGLETTGKQPGSSREITGKQPGSSREITGKQQASIGERPVSQLENSREVLW